jgi:hypothetical protein
MTPGASPHPARLRWRLSARATSADSKRGLAPIADPSGYFLRTITLPME